MPDTLRLPDGGYMRRTDVHQLIQELYTLHCVEVVGISNVGKSALLHLLAQPDVWVQELGEAGRAFLPIYVDCNRMLAMSDHAFYELVLRCLQESSPTLAALPELIKDYATVVAPVSEFQAPLGFNHGLTAVLQQTPFRLVLLIDELDEPFAQINSRVFLNLRALRDRFPERLVLVTATGQPLILLRKANHCAEFCELFSHHTWQLAPLTRQDVERFAKRYMADFDVQFTPADVDFLYEWAGGHPRLLQGARRVLEEVLEQATVPSPDPDERGQLHREAARALRNDGTLTLECAKLWDECSASEQAALPTLFQASRVQIPSESELSTLAELQRRHLLLRIEGKYHPFCRLLSDFIQRKCAPTRPPTASLWVDVECGEVVVNGKPIESLTSLEYKLMRLLFQQTDKIVDKYEIVTNVWGESYMDEVDDARIEKLVSRLRQKIEADPSAPHFLSTVRGRGYKLTLA